MPLTVKILNFHDGFHRYSAIAYAVLLEFWCYVQVIWCSRDKLHEILIFVNKSNIFWNQCNSISNSLYHSNVKEQLDWSFETCKISFAWVFFKTVCNWIIRRVNSMPCQDTLSLISLGLSLYPSLLLVLGNEFEWLRIFLFGKPSQNWNKVLLSYKRGKVTHPNNMVAFSMRHSSDFVHDP